MTHPDSQDTREGLVERLRARRSPDAFIGANQLWNPDGPEAADRIEQLEARTLPAPSEAMIEAGADALFKVSDFEGQYAELSEMSRQIYREKAYAVLRAAISAMEASQ